MKNVADGHLNLPEYVTNLTIALVRMTASRDAVREAYNASRQAYHAAVTALHQVTRERDQLKRLYVELLHEARRLRAANNDQERAA